MKKAVFIDEARRKSLDVFLQGTADKITAAGNAVKANFPALTWNTLCAVVLHNESAARDYLCRMILDATAERLKLPCYWDEQHPVEETRLNRKLVDLQARDVYAPIKDFNGVAYLETYLRTGAITINKKGQTVIAEDAAARLDDFCTVYAETEEQARFVAGVERMQRAALELEAAYQDTCATLTAKTHRAALGACAWAYKAAQFGLVPGAAGTIQLTAKDATARALISYFDRTRDTAPKFYNLAGILAYTGEDAAKAVGRRAAFKLLENASRYYSLYHRQAVDRRYMPDIDTYPAIIVEG